jgi:hypothetical protein
MLCRMELIAPLGLLVLLAIAAQLFGVDTRDLLRGHDTRGSRAPLV